MPKKTNWTAEMLSLLGTMPDKELAERLGLHHATVWRERTRQKRGAWTARQSAVTWTPEALAQLGRVSDYQLALQLGVNSGVVRGKRCSLGIPSGSPRPRRVWTEAEVTLLGTASDQEMAEQLGCTSSQIFHARKQRNILHFRPVHWADAVFQQLGVVPDTQIAQVAGISASAVWDERKRRGIPAARVSPWFDGHLAELGTKPDSQIAKQHGVSIATVAKLRQAHGIPPNTKRRAWRPEELELLGKFSDAEVARRTGRTKSGVSMERMNRRIRGIDPREAVRQYRQARLSA